LLLSLAVTPAMARENFYGGYRDSHNMYISTSPLIHNFVKNVFTGIASFYGRGERLNKHTSDGALFNPNGLTAAHRTLPFGTKLRITYKGHSIIVRVTDRGPALRSREIDLSYGAAKAIGLDKVGTARVQISRLD
jgi:rare lipoprotein A